jgi:hypothetical protein
VYAAPKGRKTENNNNKNKALSIMTKKNKNKKIDIPFYPEEKIAFFIDGSNLYAAAARA